MLSYSLSKFNLFTSNVYISCRTLANGKTQMSFFIELAEENFVKFVEKLDLKEERTCFGQNAVYYSWRDDKVRTESSFESNVCHQQNTEICFRENLLHLVPVLIQHANFHLKML